MCGSGRVVQSHTHARSSSLCFAAGITDKDVSLMNGILFPINLCCVGNGKLIPALNHQMNNDKTG